MEYTINLASLGNGIVSGGGTFSEGEIVTCTATPEPEYSFGYWEINGQACSTKNPLKFIPTGSIDLSAYFYKPAEVEQNDLPYTAATNILMPNGQTLVEYLQSNGGV